MKKILLASISLIPRAFSFAEEKVGLVPDCGRVVNGIIAKPCNFEFLIQLINKVITFLLTTFATPLFALIIIYAGWLYLSSGGSTENVSKAKKILKNAIIGYVIALAAWLIVKTILSVSGFDSSNSFL